ncbi:DUF4249 domain-containing protein [Algibacter sp. AS12]|uniref:DUF4249 domain-containing protein n=1 Tax=Algibacter sp. AS12 TaxID=3135773 RepID=UPI00398AAB9C
MRTIKYITSIILIFLVTSCEDVIDLKLNNSEPKLVIDAALNWQKGTDGKSQAIKLSLTAPFFDSTNPPASGATVTVTDSNSNTFNFIEESNTGIYKNNSFIPELNGVYILSISYNNELYTATETLIPVVPIEDVEQKDDGGFSGEDIELKAYYTDPEGVKNYYIFEFNIVKFETTFIEVYDDEFSDGNRIFAFYSNDDMQLVDDVIITSYGISERTYQFYNILLEQTDENSGDPFSVQPSTVRGNCVNQTNPDNFPLGYFRVSESDAFTYTIK